MLANMYLSKDQPMKYFVATMRCDQFDSLDKILTETKVNIPAIFFQGKLTFDMPVACNTFRLKIFVLNADWAVIKLFCPYWYPNL